jgi:CRP-like cAMP-binding protein
MMNLLHRKAPQRVARLLLELPEWVEGEPSASGLWSHALAHRIMAAIIGVTPETFSRVLKSLERRRVIVMSGKRIEILNAQALRCAAGVDRGFLGT